jgi:hypothetical protein
VDQPGRHDRRADVVTHRVRVTLADTDPPLWRSLDLASDLLLAELHDVLQAAFGWTDSHLHRFDAHEEYETEDGLPEDGRLDDLLADVGDSLLYVYDFGDNWSHTVQLEAVLPRDAAAPRAVCTAGERPGPAEDCGGVDGYELFAAATDPTHPGHAAARAEIAQVHGPEIELEAWAPVPFDLDGINERLAHPPTRLPRALTDLLQAAHDPRDQRRLIELVDAAALDEPVEIDATDAAAAVRPYTWLLDRVGDDGITLTGAGYLPPAHVTAAVAELGVADEWPGRHNREVRTLPVLHLRETAQEFGLLRKYKGRLLLTAAGRRLRSDPAALWWHLAERMPVPSRDAVGSDAGLAMLLAVAAGTPGDLGAAVAPTLRAIGWANGDGSPIAPSAALRAAWDTWTVLRRLGALTPGASRFDEQPTPAGTVFARAALRAWP